MFVWPDGSVTGSVNWGQLEQLVASRSDESVTDAGWAALDALLAERAEARRPKSDQSEPVQGEGYESQKVEDLKAQLKARDLPSSGNKAELVERLQAADAEPAAEDFDDLQDDEDSKEE